MGWNGYPGRIFKEFFAIVLAGATGIVLLGLWVYDAHGLSASKIARLHPGLTGGQVEAIAGRPSHAFVSEYGSRSWYYTRWTWCQIKVHFTPEGQVYEIDHDH